MPTKAHGLIHLYIAGNFIVAWACYYPHYIALCLYLYLSLRRISTDSIICMHLFSCSDLKRSSWRSSAQLGDHVEAKKARKRRRLCMPCMKYRSFLPYKYFIMNVKNMDEPVAYHTTLLCQIVEIPSSCYLQGSSVLRMRNCKSWHFHYMHSHIQTHIKLESIVRPVK